METSQSLSRRNFMSTAALTAGVTALGTTVLGQASAESSRPQGRLPREVWIASVSQTGMSANTPQQMVQNVIALMEKSTAYHPDVICLPEVFMTNRVNQRLSLTEQVDVSSELLKDIMAFAKTHQCYVICPMMSRDDERVYNIAVVIDRQGNRVGEYRKIYIPDEELAQNIAPGPLLPPVFKTDFGVIGIQICFDCNWNTGWEALRKQGAEMIFWPSAYSGGKVINTRAWLNRCVVVTSTWEISKICDIAGETVAQTGNWDRNLVIASVNLEKAIFPTWPNNRYFDQIRAKYGRKLNMITYHEEQWTIIESLSADLRVADVLKEFNIRTVEKWLHDAEVIGNERRS
ncbi:MAG: twin-arginine translocation signal domain-containing protein [Planctomycetaceae bacterium]|nr:twin-arginine translocation signal domain-containing protein [Planctomycetaceae bacterium]